MYVSTQLLLKLQDKGIITGEYKRLVEVLHNFYVTFTIFVSYIIHHVREKRCHVIFASNFAKYSPTDLAANL